jgi:hypothetical protein
MFALALVKMFRRQQAHSDSSLTESEMRWICDYVLHQLKKGEIEKAIIQLRIAERRISIIAHDKDSEDKDRKNVQ